MKIYKEREKERETERREYTDVVVKKTIFKKYFLTVDFLVSYLTWI